MTLNEPRGLIVPGWATASIMAIVLATGGWTATTIFALRDQAALHAEKVRVLELHYGAWETPAWSMQIAEMRGELKAMRVEVTALRQDLREGPR